jgi:hypothetical protein
LRGSGWKRLALVLAGLLAAELTTQLGAALGGGLAPVAAERERLLASVADRDGRSAGGGAVAAPRLPAAAMGAEAARSPIVLQPYLGYVLDPEVEQRRKRPGSGAVMVTEDGFLATPDPPPTGDPDEVEVGLFGGSVALILCVHGHDALLAGLARFPGFEHKRLALRCFALGGYKQPQQLMTLAYLLALGRKLDVVINLDGFNEVALAFGENWPSGVFPFYPRGWSTLVEGIPDIRQQRLVGAIVDLEDRRVCLARAFSRLPWRYSAVCNLLWETLDHDLEAKLGETRMTLQRTGSAARGRYLARGPRRQYRSAEDLFQDLAAGWQRSSLAMSHLCAGAGIRYYHFLQPNQYDPGGKPMGAAERRTAYRADHVYRQGVEEGYPLLARAGLGLAAGGVKFYDARRVFAGIHEPLYIDQCCHFSPQGNQVLGAWMATKIVQDLGAAQVGAGPAASRQAVAVAAAARCQSKRAPRSRARRASSRRRASSSSTRRSCSCQRSGRIAGA